MSRFSQRLRRRVLGGACVAVGAMIAAAVPARANDVWVYTENFEQYPVTDAVSINGRNGWTTSSPQEPSGNVGWYVANNSLWGENYWATGNFLLRGHPFSSQGQDWATLHVTAPKPLTSLSLAFTYRLDGNERGKVEISGNGTNWVDITSNMGITTRYSHDQFQAAADVSSVLNAAGVQKDVYLRFNAWNPSGSGVWHWFAIDNISLSQKVTLGEPGAGMPPSRPTYTTLPDDGQDNLVVVTHGWNPSGGSQSWVDEMRSAIGASAGNSWQVSKYDWMAQASSTLTPIAEAEAQGRKLGTDIAAQGRAQVHLLAHSAGAALIQEAARIIKLRSPSTTVQLTFLDPFMGFTGAKRSVYGSHADWADSYCAHDDLTDLPFSYTEGPLPHARNVDVTWLDPNRVEQEIAPGVFQAVSTHGWPVDFYKGTIPPNSSSLSEGYGYPRSIEGGGWSMRGSYPVGNDPPYALGGALITQGTIPLHFDQSRMFGTMQYTTSTTGSVDISGTLLTMRTGSPVWITSALDVTDPVNLVSFTAGFTSAPGAEGLLSVYWNNTLLGTIDERYALDGTQQYLFELPETFEPGTYALGFRLDPFSLTQSVVVIDQVSTGFSAVPEPGSLALLALAVTGMLTRRRCPA